MPRRGLTAVCFAYSILSQRRAELGSAFNERVQNLEETLSWATRRSSTKSTATIESMANMAEPESTCRSVWVVEGDLEVRTCAAGEDMFLPQDFLLAHPPGPYTCARTAGQRSIGMLDFQLDRLRASAEATGLRPAAREEDFDSLAGRTTTTIARTMKAFLGANTQEGLECMITVLYTGRGRGWEHEDTGSPKSKEEHHCNPVAAVSDDFPISKLGITAHAWPLSVALAKPTWATGIDVLVAGDGRKLPEAKHSSWLRDRRRLEELKPKLAVAEVVLTKRISSNKGVIHQHLLEGLTSNMFVVEEDGSVCTAPSGVLQGGMRQLCLSACKHLGISVRLEAPDLSRAPLWREAFVTGTGRVLAPIAALLIPCDDDKSPPSVNNLAEAPRPTITRIEMPTVPGGADRLGRYQDGHAEGIAQNEVPASAGVEVGMEKSIAQQLRHRMLIDFKDGATRLL